LSGYQPPSGLSAQTPTTKQLGGVQRGTPLWWCSIVAPLPGSGTLPPPLLRQRVLPATRGRMLHFVQLIFLFFNFLFLAEPPIHFRELLLLPEITFRMRITGKFQKFIEIRKSR
jgi:hypothetical protein